MKFLKKMLTTLALFLTGFNANLYAQQAEPITIDLISSVKSISPGNVIEAALRVQMENGWHTYWINPGDSGAAPKIAWVAQKGVSIGDLNFPVPERIEYGELVNFGYSDETVWPFEIRVEKDFPENLIKLFAEIDILVCSDICIPKKIKVSKQIQIGNIDRDDIGTRIISSALDAMPINSALAPLAFLKKDKIELKFGLSRDLASKASTEAYFFPFVPNLIDNKATQNLYVSGDKFVLAMDRSLDYTSGRSISGILKIDGAAYALDTTISDSSQGPEISSVKSPLTAIFFAFVGGLILNLMPCVFPVLSVKVLSLINHSNTSKKYLVMSGWIYSLGVVISFALLGLTVISLRAGGEAIGWGFQLQSPLVVIVLVYLFVLIGLNLLGLFEINFSMSEKGAARGYSSAFFSGVLATIVASPCTAPFMAAALSYALLQSPDLGIMIFLSLGSGMAFPFLLLCYFPKLLSRLPKPGIWMVILKEFLAFPMFASAIWLIWVLQSQEDGQFLAATLVGVLFLGFGVWLIKYSSKMLARFVSFAFFAFALAIPVQQLFQGNSSSSKYAVEKQADIDAFSVARLEELIETGPVFVNFTASWCITCKVNEVTALRTQKVMNAFQSEGITYLEADWSNEDPDITEALESYGRAGVPLYLFFGKGSSDPMVLPQILTEDIVLSALQNRGSSQFKGVN